MKLGKKSQFRIKADFDVNKKVCHDQELAFFFYFIHGNTRTEHPPLKSHRLETEFIKYLLLRDID